MDERRTTADLETDQARQQQHQPNSESGLDGATAAEGTDETHDHWMLMTGGQLTETPTPVCLTSPRICK